jgi:hypothetical protein
MEKKHWGKQSSEQHKLGAKKGERDLHHQRALHDLSSGLSIAQVGNGHSAIAIRDVLAAQIAKYEGTEAQIADAIEKIRAADTLATRTEKILWEISNRSVHDQEIGEEKVRELEADIERLESFQLDGFCIQSGGVEELPNLGVQDERKNHRQSSLAFEIHGMGVKGDQVQRMNLNFFEESPLERGVPLKRAIQQVEDTLERISAIKKQYRVQEGRLEHASSLVETARENLRSSLDRVEGQSVPIEDPDASSRRTTPGCWIAEDEDSTVKSAVELLGH